MPCAHSSRDICTRPPPPWRLSCRSAAALKRAWRKDEEADRWLFRATLSALLCVSAVAVYLGVRLHYAEDPVVIRSKFETPIVMRTEEGLLEVTKVAATTTFERTDPSHFWGIGLGKTVSRIRVQ